MRCIFFKSSAVAILATFLLCGSLSTAQADDGLYAPPPPPGSAFVRFINGDTQAETAAAIRGKSHGVVPLGEVSAYLPVQQGEADMALGGGKTTAALKEGVYYSAVLKGGKLTVVSEPAYDRKIKVQLMLFNLSDETSVGLTAKQGASVIKVMETVKSGGHEARAVNAMKIGFAVTAADGVLKDIEPKPLERGGSYAVVVYKGADGKTAVNYDQSDMP